MSKYIISRWMKEAGLKYKKHKKSYYVDRHEDEDVVSDRKTYVETSFNNEIREHCWIQISRTKYLSLKYNNKITTIKVEKTTIVKKNELDDLPSDLVTDIHEYIGKKQNPLLYRM